MNYCCLIDYFIKGLCPDEQRGIRGYLKDNCNSYYAKKYAKYQDENYQTCLKNGIFNSVEEIEKFLSNYVEHFIAVNNRMMKNGRAP